MKFQECAPQELVGTYRKLHEEEQRFQAQEWTMQELEAHAKAAGFSSWRQFDQCKKLQLDILKRYLTRPEMFGVWAELRLTDFAPSISTASWLYRRTTMAVDKWYRVARVGQTDRAAAYRQIAKKALELADLLKAYELGDEYDFRIYRFIGNDHKQKLGQLLSQDIPVRVREQINFVYQMVCPTFSELLEQLSSCATEDSKNPREGLVRKVNSKTARRTYLIQAVARCFLQMGAYSPTAVATCVAVALDDAEVTPDLVRHMCQKIVAEWAE